LRMSEGFAFASGPLRTERLTGTTNLVFSGVEVAEWNKILY